MRAKVQGRFPFLGKMRKPGDILTEEELSQCSPQVRDALVSQKLIVLDADTQSGDMVNRINALATRLANLEQSLGVTSDQPEVRRSTRKAG